MSPSVLVTALLAVLAWLAPAVPAQHVLDVSPDVAAFIEQADAALHSPWTEMREFCAEVQISGLVLPGSTIRYLWRRDGESEARLEGQADPNVEALLDSFLLPTVMETAMGETTFPPLRERLQGCDVSLTRLDDGWRLDVVALRDDVSFRRMALTYDERYLPRHVDAHLDSPLTGVYSESTDLFVEELGGRWVVTGARSETDNQITGDNAQIEFEWVEVGEHLVVRSFQAWGVQGDQRSLISQIVFEDILIDEGFGDGRPAGALDLLLPGRPRFLALGGEEPDVRGHLVRLEAGPFAASARSVTCTPELILRDGDGRILARARGRDGQAVLVTELPASGEHVLELALQDGLPGAVALAWDPTADDPAPVDETTAMELLTRLLTRGQRLVDAQRPLEAEAYVRRGVTAARQWMGADSVIEADLLVAQGRACLFSGRLDEARRLAGEADRIYVAWDEGFRRLQSLTLAAEADHASFRFAAARENLEAAIELLSFMPDHSRGYVEGRLYGFLSAVAHQQGRLDEAIETIRRVLPVARRAHGADGPFTLMQQSLLAEYLAERGDLDEALELMAGSVSLARRERGPLDHVTHMLMHSEARVLGLAGQREQAIDRLLDLLDLAELDVVGDDGRTINLLADLAIQQLALDRLDAAEASLTEAVERARALFGADSDAVAVYEDALATVLREQGRLDEALDLAAGALSRMRRRLERELASLTESQRLTWADQLRLDLDLAVAQAWALDGDGDEAAALWGEVLGWKGLVSRGLLRERRWVEASADPELTALVARLRRVVSQLSASALELSLSEQERDLQALLVERRELEERIARRRADDGADQQLEPARVQAALAPDEALVDLLVVRSAGLDRVVAWVLRSEGPVQPVDLGPASGLEAALAEHLDGLGIAQLEAARGRAVGRPAARPARGPDLASLLWAPLAPHLEGARRVFVCPEGALATLPFGTLPATAPGRYLLEERAFVYLQSAAELLTVADGEAGSPQGAGLDGPAVVLGGVDYGSPAVPPHAFWPPLPGTAEEARVVAGLLGTGGEVTLLGAAEAGEQALRRAVPGASIVHLATHGFFTPEGLGDLVERLPEQGLGAAARRSELERILPGLRSGLVLAGVHDPGADGLDDGLLTAEEAGWLDLSACQLVVLSACETGLGTPSGGDNLIGLRRALYLAGARSRVTSLWKVEDQATRELMEAFYTRLLVDGQGRGEALRGARLDQLERQRAAPGGLVRPSTWGAFVLEGAWR